MLKRHNQFFKGLMLLNDFFFLSIAWWLAYGARFHTRLFPSPETHVFQHYVAGWILMAVVWVSVFILLDIYRPRRLSSPWREAGDILKGSALALLVFLGFVFLLHSIVLSRIAVSLFWAASFALLNLSRLLAREALRCLRRRGYNLRRIAVIGTPRQALQLTRKLESYNHLGFRISGVCCIGNASASERDDGKALLLKSREEILQLVRLGAADQVFITLPLEEASKLKEIRGWLGDEPVTIYFVPDLGDLRVFGGDVESFDGLQIIGLQDSPLSGWHALLKRIIDLTVGGVALITVSPLMALIAISIKLTSPGKVLYRQERMGLDGKRFQILKFRSMVRDAEKHTGPVWAAADDPRVTRVGSWLRRSSLDELPQLINVLRGEMSLVGPRPERPALIEEFRRSIPRYMLRHKVKAGMTGWAQVNGWRGNTPLGKRIEHDLYYIENWSLWYDLKILARTLLGGFRNNRASN